MVSNGTCRDDRRRTLMKTASALRSAESDRRTWRNDEWRRRARGGFSVATAVLCPWPGWPPRDTSEVVVQAMVLDNDAARDVKTTEGFSERAGQEAALSRPHQQ